MWWADWLADDPRDYARYPGLTKEYLHINLLENYADRCVTCEPLLKNRVTAKTKEGFLRLIDRR